MGRKMLLAFVSLLAGLMIAVLFQSNQKPETRDTRDLWEIRTELNEEQIKQQNLYKQISEAEEIINQYENEPNTEKIETLKEQVNKLKEKAGLSEKQGKGLVITVKPIFRDIKNGQAYPTIPPELINRLLNELKLYGATDIAIENERIISITPVRAVGDSTYVNNRPVPPLPIDIKVMSKDLEKLMDYMEVNKINDYFAIENIELSYEIEEVITLPKYDMPIDFQWFDSENVETGES